MHGHTNIKFEEFSKNLLRKFKFHSNMRSTMGTSHEDLSTFFISR